MKILRLYFENINSLQGENKLDFTQAPLADAGVFAITGPNGSGKSSILDAITLALYGETFKFDRPAEHVMTRHTTNCFAQIEFSVNNTDYRSRWQVTRTQDEHSSTLPAGMELHRLGEENEVLATDAATVRAKIAEIIGLDFKNFTRSTLLAQGDFAAFLNALDSERLDILEKILSTDIYEEYKHDIHQKAEQEQVLLAGLQADLTAVPLLDATTLEAHEQDLADFTAQLDEFKGALHTLTAQMSGLQTLADLDAQTQQTQLKQQTLHTQLQQISADLTRIETFKGLTVLQEEGTRVDSVQATLADNATALSDYRNELTQLQAQLQSLGESATDDSELIAGKSIQDQQTLISDLSFQVEHLDAENTTEKALGRTLEDQLIDKQVEAQTLKTWLDEHTKDASLLEGFPEIGPLKALTTQQNDLKRQQKITFKSSKVALATEKNNQSEIRSLTREIPELQADVKAYERQLSRALKNHRIEELEALYVEQQERVKDYKELIALATLQNRFKDGLLVRLGLVRPAKAPDLTAISQEITEHKTRLLTEENIKKALQQAVSNEALLLKMQADRSHLVDNEPCPLCGALKHPYVTQPPKTIDSKQALTDQTGRVQALNAIVARLERSLQTAQKQLDNQELKANRLSRIQSDWATLCNRLNIVSADISIDDLKSIKKLLTKQVTELNDIKQLLNNARDLTQKITTANAQIETKTETLTRLQGVIQATEVDSVSPTHALNEIEQKLAKNTEETTRLSEKVLTQLAELGEKFPAKGKEDALFDRLNQRRQAYQSALLRDNKLAEDIAALQKKINEVHVTVTSRDAQIEATGNKLRTAQSTSLHLAVIEKQKLINEKDAKIAQLKTQQHTAQQALLAEAKEFGVQSYSELTELLHLLPQQATLQQQQQETSTQLQDLDTRLQAIEQQKLAEQAQLLTDKPLAICEVEQASLLEKIDIAQQEVARLQAILAKQDSLQEKVKTLKSKIAEQALFVELATTELQQITTDNGHVFRRKVQRKTADKLLSRTNQILEKISGRFYVRQGNNAQGLALEIEDTFQQNTRRLPKTLSGGESFVVSLALALGLSDLASNGHAIESLFLDEGFGNLDAEALYIVVSTLEGLQTQGKKVGVISHVEGVRKRIKTQIEMTKNPNGLSAYKLLV